MAEEFTVRAFAQAGGSASLKAYKAMNSAILAAKRQIQNAASHGTQNPVKMAGEHSATVKSAKDCNTEYDVQLPEDASDNITCTCQAGRFKLMCWHVAAVLLEKGASENLLLRHMGIQLGSQSGGYRQLMHGMSAAAAAAAPAAVAAVPMAGSVANAPATSSQGCENDSMEDEPARSEDQARASAEAQAGEPEPSVAARQPHREKRSAGGRRSSCKACCGWANMV